MLRRLALTTMALFWMAACGRKGEEGPVLWEFDNLETLGGSPITVYGDPEVIDTPKGKALEFDGEDDGVFVDVHPIAGMEQFTAEVVFQPYAGGLSEQRFMHMQQDGSTERLMFETRLTGDGHWYLDTFIQTGDSNHAQLARDFLHPIGPWYHAAVVVDGETFRHYVNGKLEMSTPISYKAQKPGKSSIGVRQNMVYWFKGAIRVARFTPRPLPADEFLIP